MGGGNTTGSGKSNIRAEGSGLKGERKGSDRMGTAQVNGTDKPVVRTGPEKVMGDDERWAGPSSFNSLGMITP